MTNHHLTIATLADHPDLVEVVGRWHWDEWGHEDPAGSLAAWTGNLRGRANRDRLPMLFIALIGDEPIGSASLVEHDLATHTQLTPWLSGVFVVPAHRGRGAGSALVRHAAAAAATLGVRRLYLHTVAARGFYERLGWHPIAAETNRGDIITTMALDLPPT